MFSPPTQGEFSLWQRRIESHEPCTESGPGSVGGRGIDMGGTRQVGQRPKSGHKGSPRRLSCVSGGCLVCLEVLYSQAL